MEIEVVSLSIEGVLNRMEEMCLLYQANGIEFETSLQVSEHGKLKAFIHII